MSKKQKIELNRMSDFTDIDAELEDALAKLDATSSRVDEILATDAGVAKPAHPEAESVEDDGEDESGEEE